MTAGADLIGDLRSLRAQGRFEEAAALVRVTDDAPADRLSPSAHAAAGTALAEVSDYASAGVHLLLAAADPLLAPTALGRLAELAWIEHDHARGQAFALTGLSLDPTHPDCRIQLQRNDLGLDRETSDDPGDRPGRALSQATGFADPHPDAGHRAQTDSVRRCFGGATAQRWYDVHVHQLFDERRLAEVNATAGLIVGGGELLRPDIAPNGNSGWQWNITDAVLARIDVPLVVFAVGHTWFTRPEPGGRLAGGLRALVERAAFVGLRHHESVDRVRELLPDHLAARIGWQPCPTTITDRLPGLASRTRTPSLISGGFTDPTGEPGAVLLNCALDRPERRFGDGYGRFLEQMRDWVIGTRAHTEVRYAAHRADDERFVDDLRREHGLTLPVTAMYDLTPAQIQHHYRRAGLVVADAAHAAMIPFGCGTPIIGLLSDRTLGYFLDDLGHPEWGVDVRTPNLAGRLPI